jgi:hypothetical protein
MWRTITTLLSWPLHNYLVYNSDIINSFTPIRQGEIAEERGRNGEGGERKWVVEAKKGGGWEYKERHVL